MNTQEILSFFQFKYPHLNFDTLPSKEVAADFDPSYIATLNLPEFLICFEFQGMCITDVYSSDCSRFKENPSYYGIEEQDAQKFLEHNKICIH